MSKFIKTTKTMDEVCNSVIGQMGFEPDMDYDWGASLTIQLPKGFKTKRQVFLEMVEISEAIAYRCLDDFVYSFVSKCTPEEIEELKEILKTKGANS